MSANHPSTDSAFIERSPFLNVYPVCSKLISEIGREFIRSWTVEQANTFRAELLSKLVASGVSREMAGIAWKLVVQEYGESRSAVAKEVMRGDSTAPVLATSTAASANRLITESANENIFSHEDGRWVVRFRNQTIYPQDITGIKYLHYLISNPGVTFSPSELYNGFGGRKATKNPNSMSAGEAIASGVGFTAGKPDVVVDEQGRQDLLARLESIECEMAKAKLVPDADLIEKLAAERIGIQEYLRKAFTPVGSRRIREPDGVRRMKAVDIAIRRAKEKIQRAGHNELLRHLNESVEVKVKSGCRYFGNYSSWRTEPIKVSASVKPR